jgi:hypothetical protein
MLKLALPVGDLGTCFSIAWNMSARQEMNKSVPAATGRLHYDLERRRSETTAGNR